MMQDRDLHVDYHCISRRFGAAPSGAASAFLGHWIGLFGLPWHYGRVTLLLSRTHQQGRLTADGGLFLSLPGEDPPPGLLPTRGVVLPLHGWAIGIPS